MWRCHWGACRARAQYGIAGGSIAVVITVSVRAALQCFLAHQAYPHSIPVVRILCLWTIALGAVILCDRIGFETLWVSLVWKGSVMTIATAGMAAAFVDPQGWKAFRRQGRKCPKHPNDGEDCVILIASRQDRHCGRQPAS